MMLPKITAAALTTLSFLLDVGFAGKCNQPGTFSYNRTSFLLNDKPYQIIGGQMDPQRIPREYWAERLQMAKAMGLNTIFSYLFWNDLEPTPGNFNFEDRNDVARFFRIAQKQGLKIVLRPGPYICGEHEWGGFPAWLTQVPGMAVRQNNQPFLDASKQYLDRIGKELGPLEITKGGPIIMVQLENEYGSFGSDKTYLQKMADLLRANFVQPLYTNDGGGKSYLDGGTLHGVLAETDGDPKTGFEARDQYVTDPTMLGPQLDGEYYTTWFDAWDPTYAHSEADAATLKQNAADVEYTLSNGHSLSFYMFHGGTNWGFANGGIAHSNSTYIVPTSYDYGAPLDESGRPSAVYGVLRDTIVKHVPKGSIPEVPYLPPLAAVPKFDLRPVANFFDVQRNTYKKTTEYPVTMETLDQAYGFVLYEHNITKDASGTLVVGDKPRDRVLVYVNNIRQGVVDGIYDSPNKVAVNLKAGDKLQLLVENMGRVDYSRVLLEQLKGIKTNVTVAGGDALKGWATYSMALNELPNGAVDATAEYKVEDKSVPVFYKGSFMGTATDMSGDTFLSLPNGYKGIVWINGRLIGKYWAIGPQQSLYIPGVYLKAPGTPNEIIIAELEPESGMKQVAEGIAERKWFNQADKNRQ